MPNIRRIKINDVNYDVRDARGSRVYVGTCSTAAATNPKVCTVEEFPTDSNGLPYVGVEIAVKFTATNTSTSTTPQLNVNDTGAIGIWYNNAALATAKSAYSGYANRYLRYMYDGTYWVFLGHSVDNNNTYTNVALGLGYAVLNNAAASSTITAALSSYKLAINGIVSVKFIYDVPANATLNINSVGAKAIYNKDSAISAGVIKAGDTATFIYNTYYRLISVDSWLDTANVNDANPFIVDVTLNGSTISNPSKTLTEIKSAYDLGRSIILQDADVNTYYCTYCDELGAGFMSYNPSTLQFISVDDSNVWSYEEIDLASKIQILNGKANVIYAIKVSNNLYPATYSSLTGTWGRGTTALTGESKNIYIDVENDDIYYWDIGDLSFKCLTSSSTLTSVTVSGTGAVTLALDSNKFYKFGSLTSLTITLNAATEGLAIYGGKFTADSSGCTLTVPSTVTVASSVPTIEGGSTYEFNIMDNVLLMIKI